MEFNKLKMPSISNNFLVWAVVIVIVLGFGKSSNTLGFNFFGIPDASHKTSHKHYPNDKSCAITPNKAVFPPIPFLGNAGGFLGGNGIFIIAIIALLFLCKDDKKERCNDATVIDYSEVDN